MKKQKTKRKSNEIGFAQIMKGKILYDNVLIKPIVLEKVGLVLRPQQYEDKPEFGEVLMVGEGRIFDNGTVIPLKVKVGDVVYFQKFSSQKIRVEGVDYHIIREEDIYWHD